ncbi:MAG: hypothetical protein A2408_03670 [Candidatus Yonathbacteria bacterium RIFOXYC1_FULL_52_10]|uniref:Uncharacterized protein n=1 Tax=Candidatus Yonathbacteria bacterium RIFOXYD1_FULL_52_36 TaxID=1802730 RepID=A0A1G2SJ78_9BACT|nr:MAG: hypothetical protein A2591_00365 [Candidatus Yonathbacteria bacterium RIFOXYD1_FULL_52_36]OHA85282.1 MAG: hypothetical protein A2408_03670 [Candidatus Yonathbacteria bacterium RIFOXYC1_FULL_52_10]
MISTKKSFLLPGTGALFFGSILASTAYAEDILYRPMVGLPGIPAGQGTTFMQYAPAFFTVLIATAGILAVVMIVVGGIRLVVSGASESERSKGKEQIGNAIAGLVLIALSWLILNVINPNLVNVQFSVPASPAVIINGSGSSFFSGGSVSGSRSTATGGPYQTCTSCVSLSSSIPQKGVGAGCSVPVGGGGCVVDATTAQKLENMAATMQARGVAWEVTEMWPPTRAHQAACQNNGPQMATCVDAAIRSTPSATNVQTTIDAARQAGLRPHYEVSSEARRQDLIRAGISPQDVSFPKKADGTAWITGEHFSLYGS